MRDLTKGNPTRLMILFALPVLLGNICQLFYNLVDTKIVGEVLGGNSLAALGAAGPLNTLIVGFLLGLTNGFAILVSRSFGAKKETELRKNVAGTLVLGLATSIVLTIISLIFLKPMLHM
ncbi:MAG: MATE family efflux transporter, partial [Lachnospiraceae bacterium]|nr:MATE family efflux transporter [Lachnospiraceae bacterium]